MKRIERRAGLCLLLAAALVLGLGIFTFRELRSGGAWAASALIWSAMTMCPAYCPSTATWMMVPSCLQFRVMGTPIFSIRRALPA